MDVLNFIAADLAKSYQGTSVTINDWWSLGVVISGRFATPFVSSFHFQREHQFFLLQRNVTRQNRLDCKQFLRFTWRRKPHAAVPLRARGSLRLRWVGLTYLFDEMVSSLTTDKSINGEEFRIVCRTVWSCVCWNLDLMRACAICMWFLYCFIFYCFE